MTRADIRAVAALYALEGIDNGEVIDDLDGVSRAFALALHAADAAEVAHLHNLCALIMVAAGRHDLLALGNELDDALGAGVGTCAAANTAGTVDLCNAIDDMYRVELAGSGAVAETDAGESAGLVALAAEQHGSAAIDGAGVVEAHLGVSGNAGAGHESDHFLNIGAGDAHDLGYLCRSLCAAGNALIGRCFASGDSGGIAVTAGVSAAAAVCAGQTCTNFLLLGVY